MDSLTTHPSTAAQAKAFTAPSSLSFPGGLPQDGAGNITPNSEKDGQTQSQAVVAQGQAGANGVTPATPAATPGAGPGVSGIVPQLQ